MSHNDLRASSGSVRLEWELAQADRVRAAVAVAGRAEDAEDAGELLAMLGLLTPSDGLQHDRQCPSRLAHGALRLRRAAGKPAAKTATPNPAAPHA